ncbi:DUF3618 domain-containing protein [Streptomyces sp. NPDC088180]|uniref:DUF3618 domain-containing protein n=1 Tax=Streptomyces sp. NPDC088180 TaxID=3365837 RepID=UPI00381F0D52
MNDASQNDTGTPTPEELRHRVERTRDKLGQTVEALAAKADLDGEAKADLKGRAKDLKEQAKDTVTTVRERAAGKAGTATGRVRHLTEQTARRVKDRTPDAVLEETARVTARLRERTARAGRYAAVKAPDPLRDGAERAATAVRAHRAPLLTGSALLVAFLLVRRSRGRTR